MRLDLALIRLHPELSRRKAREVIEKGQVTVDGATVLEAGQRGRAGRGHRLGSAIARPRSRARALAAASCTRTTTVLVVDKPAGLLAVPTAPDAAGEDTALARVQEYVAPPAARGGPTSAWCTGSTATPRARSPSPCRPPRGAALRDLFREHRIERRYAALVHGAPPRRGGVVDLPIHDVYEGGRRRVARPGEPSRAGAARTGAWSSASRAAPCSRSSWRPAASTRSACTSRTSGLPILGDPVYGDRGAGGPAPPRRRARCCTRGCSASRIRSTGRPVRAESPLPADFRPPSARCAAGRDRRRRRPRRRRRGEAGDAGARRRRRTGAAWPGCGPRSSAGPTTRARPPARPAGSSRSAGGRRRPGPMEPLWPMVCPRVTASPALTAKLAQVAVER